VIHPAVAIITRTKDRTLLLRRAIESVLGQIFQGWIMVIVNDGGARAPVDELVESYKDRFNGRSCVIHNETCLGMEAASNIGLKGSESRYVVIHDDDDSWHPAFLQRCTGFLDTNPYPHVAGVITYTVRVLERITHDRVVFERKEPFNAWCKSVTIYRMAASNIFPPISFVYERRVFDQIGYYRKDLPVLGDWEFNLRFMRRYDIFLIPEELAFYHHRVDATSGVFSNSVIGGDSKHLFYDTLLRNELLRDDLENNRIGMGYLTNISKSFDNLHGQLSLITDVMDRVRRIQWLKRLLKKGLR
jgi:glycosyltransferase involved in cell wall biosynthesis